MKNEKFGNGGIVHSLRESDNIPCAIGTCEVWMSKSQHYKTLKTLYYSDEFIEKRMG